MTVIGHKDKKMLHKLTQMLQEYQHSNPNKTFTEYDKIVRGYLEICAIQIGQNDSPSGFSTRHILGLEPEKKEKLCRDCNKPIFSLNVLDFIKCVCTPKEEPKGSDEKGKGWCPKGCEFPLYGCDWMNFCPICGTPRPTQIWKEHQELCEGENK